MKFEPGFPSGLHRVRLDSTSVATDLASRPAAWNTAVDRKDDAWRGRMERMGLAMVERPLWRVHRRVVFASLF